MHELVFNVLDTATHAVTLGRPFLHLTKTLTRYRHRMKELCRSIRIPRICLLGSVQRLGGYANGKMVNVVPYTGADVSAMSSAYAKKEGFKVNSAKRHRIPVQVADGSIVSAIGVVENVEWQYNADGRRYDTDVYVFENLSVDFLLGYDILRESNSAFKQEADDDLDDTVDAEEFWLYNTLKCVGDSGKPSAPIFSEQKPSTD